MFFVFGVFVVVSLSFFLSLFFNFSHHSSQRALIGIVLMCDIVDRFQSWSAFGGFISPPLEFLPLSFSLTTITENSSVSFFPTQLIKENVWQSPWLPSPFLFAPSLSPLLFAIYFVFSFLFALGVGGKGGGEMKRWVSVMCWYLNLSLQQVLSSFLLPLYLFPQSLTFPSFSN